MRLLCFYLFCSGLPPLDCRGTGGGYIAQGGDVYHTSSSPYSVRQPPASSSPYTVVWRTALGGVALQSPLTSYPMFPNGSVIPASMPLSASLPIQAFVVGSDGALSAVRCSDGALLWRFSPGRATLKSSPFVTPQGALLLPSQDSMGGGRLSSVSAVRGGGAPTWVFQGGGGLGGVTTLPPPLATPVVAGDDGHLYGVNPGTGATAWKSAIGYGGTTLPSTPTLLALPTPLLLLGTTTGTLLLYNASGGLVLTVVAGVSSWGGGGTVPPMPAPPLYHPSSTLTPVVQLDARGTPFLVWWGCDGSLYRVSYPALLQQGLGEGGGGGSAGGGGGGVGVTPPPLLYIPNSPLDPGIPLALIAGATVFDAAAVEPQRDFFLSSLCDCASLYPITVWLSPPFAVQTPPPFLMPPFAVLPRVGCVALFAPSLGGMVYLNPFDFRVAWVWGGPSSSSGSSSSSPPSITCSPPLFDASMTLLFSCSNAVLYALDASGNTSSSSSFPSSSSSFAYPGVSANATAATSGVGSGVLLWSVSLGEASTGAAPPAPTLGGDGVILAPTCDGALVGIVSSLGDLSAVGGPLPPPVNANADQEGALTLTNTILWPSVVGALVLLVTVAFVLWHSGTHRKPEEGGEEDIEAASHRNGLTLESEGATAAAAASAASSTAEEDPLSLTLKAIRAASALTMKELSLERPATIEEGGAMAPPAINKPYPARRPLKKEGGWGWKWVSALFGQPFQAPPHPQPLLSSPNAADLRAPSSPAAPSSTHPRASSSPSFKATPTTVAAATAAPSPRSPAEAFQAMLSRSTEEERSGGSGGGGVGGGSIRGSTSKGGGGGGEEERNFRDSLWRDALGGAFTALSPPTAPPPPSQRLPLPLRPAASEDAAAAGSVHTSSKAQQKVQRSAENVARAEKKRAAAAAAAAAAAEAAAKEAANALKAAKRPTPLPSFVSINPLLGGVGRAGGAGTHKG